jgi:type I restriction enzyme S subunit
MSRWPTALLRDVLELQRRWIKLEPLESYREIGIRSFGNGIFHKAPVEGSALGNKRVLRIEPGDLVFNNVFAWEGAVAVAGPNEAGMIGSHRFVTYTVNGKLAIPEFLKLFFTTEKGLEILRKASPGSAGRNKTLGLDRFIRQSITLPPVQRQERIVEWFNAVASRVDEAKRLIEITDQIMDDLSRSILWSSNRDHVTLTPMSELVRQRQPDVKVVPEGSYDFAGVYCFGRGVFRGQTRSGMDFQYPRLTRLRARNLVYPKLMAWEGALAVVPSECEGLVVSTEYPVFEIEESKVLPEVLDVYFRTPTVWPEISGASTGTNVRRRRLNPRNFLEHKFPLPTMEIQHRIREVKARTEEAKRARRRTLNDLQALLSSVSNHIFDECQ